MKKIIRLKENDLVRLVKRVMNEQLMNYAKPKEAGNNGYYEKLNVSSNVPFTTFLNQKGLKTSDGISYFSADKKMGVFVRGKDKIEVTFIGVTDNGIKNNINNILDSYDNSERFSGSGFLNLLEIKENLAKEIISFYTNK